MTAAVQLRGVSKSYDGRPVVDQLDLTAAAGGRTVLVGPSGCGKTTTLRLIAGLERQDAGEIRLGGRCADRAPPAQRDVAMVFQDLALYPHLTARGNLAFPLRMRRLDKAETARRIEQTAQLLGITELLDRYPDQLSGGQQQRVALGRALTRQPAVLLMDESLANLDAPLRALLRSEILELHARLGTTMLLVTHDQTEAMMMGERIAVMRSGRIEQTGTPQELYQQPANRFVGAFIGFPEMNLLRGRIRQGRVAIDESLWPLPEELAGRVPDGAEVEVGLRPPALRRGDVAEGHVALEARLRRRMPLGHEAILLLDWNGRSLTALVPAEELPTLGETVRVSFDSAQLHLFAADSGRRLDAGRVRPPE